MYQMTSSISTFYLGDTVKYELHTLHILRMTKLFFKTMQCVVEIQTVRS